MRIVLHLMITKYIMIIYKYLRQYTTILVLMQLYFVRGDMFRLIMQPSSGQLTIERYLIILRPIWDPILEAIHRVRKRLSPFFNFFF